MQLYKSHLQRQYRDRQQYWSNRSLSRNEATSGLPVQHVCAIVDGMDQSKHAYPKSECLSAKEFSSWVRPRLQSTTIICHGHGIWVGLSPQNTPSSGSRTMELVAHMMTQMSKPKPLKSPSHHVHWPAVFLYLQADNCVKEIKHQTCLRMMSSLVALHRLRGCQLEFLQSGHSHEDVDCHFALTSSWLDRFPHLENIADFQSCLSKFLSNKAVRVNEPHREVLVFDSFRDWNPGFFLGGIIGGSYGCVFPPFKVRVARFYQSSSPPPVPSLPSLPPPSRRHLLPAPQPSGHRWTSNREFPSPVGTGRPQRMMKNARRYPRKNARRNVR